MGFGETTTPEIERVAHEIVDAAFKIHCKVGPGLLESAYKTLMIYELTKGEAIITTDVGQHQMWAAQFYPFTRSRQWITSGGLGAMGFGLPAAIGAQMAFRDQLVVAVVGETPYAEGLGDDVLAGGGRRAQIF